MTTFGLSGKSGPSETFAGWLRATVATLLVMLAGMPAAGQVSQAASAMPGPKSLHIVILDGEGALNNIRERTAREPIVQVEDENHKPVSEAAVVFLIHGGNGTTFAGQSLSFATKTGADGKAQAEGLQVGKSPGTYTITVTATVGEIVAEAIIHQSNVLTALNTKTGGHAGTPVHGGGLFGLNKATTIVIGVGVVVVATVGIVVANGGSATSVTAGTGTVGAPGAKLVR